MTTTVTQSQTTNLEPLAEQLGVGVDVLARLKITRNGRCWLIDELNAYGEVIGQAKRYDDSSKRFVAGGHRGLTMEWPLPDYAGTSINEPILIVEGMSDTAGGMMLGFITIGRPSATGGLEFLKLLLKDLHVAIIGDNDDSVGRIGAAKMLGGLLPIAASVKVIFPPDKIKDLRSWVVDHGLGPEQLGAAIKSAPLHEPETAKTPVIMRLVDVVSRQVEWLWQDRIACGKVTLIAGDPGLGKSFLSLDMAARVSTGAGWPDRPSEKFRPGGVVLLSAEDDLADTIKPRLQAAGADMTRISAIEAVQLRDEEAGVQVETAFNLTTDLDQLEAAIRLTPDCALVIVDPISAYLGNTDSHKNSEVRALLHPLGKLAAAHKVAIVCITHLNKGAGGERYLPRDRIASVYRCGPILLPGDKRRNRPDAPTIPARGK